MIPSMPKNSGRIRSRGTRKNTCLVSDKITPFTGFPMAAKKLEESSWTPFMITINRKILRKRMANSK